MASELPFANVTVTPPLVALDVAKVHLRLPATDTTHDADLELKLQQASDAILSYLKGGADPTWAPDTVPAVVQASILFYLELLFDHTQHNNDAAVWEAIGRLLVRYRDPGLS